MVSVSIVMVSFCMKDVRAILLTANREQYEVLFPQVEGSRYFRQLFQMVKAISQLFRTDTHYHTRLGSTKVRVRIWIWKKFPVKGSRRNALR